MTMKGAYPIVLTKTDDGYYVSIPDFDVSTQGESIADAMEMARDVIGLMGIDLEDEKKELPLPNSRKCNAKEDDIITLVDVDFQDYRKKVENKAVKKNCTIPYWMSVEADRIGINYSRLLQEAIQNVLGIGKGTIN